MPPFSTWTREAVRATHRRLGLPLGERVLASHPWLSLVGWRARGRRHRRGRGARRVVGRRRHCGAPIRRWSPCRCSANFGRGAPARRRSSSGAAARSRARARHSRHRARCRPVPCAARRRRRRRSRRRPRVRGHRRSRHPTHNVDRTAALVAALDPSPSPPRRRRRVPTPPWCAPSYAAARSSRSTGSSSPGGRSTRPGAWCVRCASRARSRWVTHAISCRHHASARCRCSSTSTGRASPGAAARVAGLA